MKLAGEIKEVSKSSCCALLTSLLLKTKKNKKTIKVVSFQVMSGVPREHPIVPYHSLEN